MRGPIDNSATATVALIGAPNCGKTTVFNLLTGAHQSVGNWPGVTVERKSGDVAGASRPLVAVDLPGAYSLQSGGALDEAVAREYINLRSADLLVNIVDAKSLERQLPLTVELFESRTPMVVVLNMIDEAELSGRKIDFARLERDIGCPVVPLIATRSGERVKLIAAIERALLQDSVPRALVLPASDTPHPDGTAADDEDLFADMRFRRAQELAAAALRNPGRERQTISDRIDRIVLNRFLGVPIFLVTMYLLFVVSFSGGNIFLDFIDGASHALFVTVPGWLLQYVHAPDWLVQLVATAVGGAIQLVLPFIAPVGLTFLFLTLLEESGYMARGTFVMDRLMRRLGLPGRTLVPMIAGFGCNVPAVMATRSIEGSRDRLLVTMMQPFMSCSARLVIYMAFAAVFFRRNGGQIVFGLYLLGIVTAVLTALLLGKTVLRGTPAPFAIELPPYRIPTAAGLSIAVWQRLKTYIWRVGRVIAAATVVIYLLSAFAVTSAGLRAASDPSASLLGTVGRAVTPVFEPMGITTDNWPATVGLLTGAVAKEVVIGTLNGAYSRDQASSEPDYLHVNASRELVDAAATIPVNAAGLVTGAADPLGFANLARGDSAAAYSGASQATLRALATHFTIAGAVAYLIFVLLYIPCVSTMGAIRRETGSTRWTVYAIVWGVGVAYVLATLTYQIATFVHHPFFSGIWVAAVLVFTSVTILFLRSAGRRRSAYRSESAG